MKNNPKKLELWLIKDRYYPVIINKVLKTKIQVYDYYDTSFKFYTLKDFDRKFTGRLP